MKTRARIRLVRRLRASPGQVFDAWLDPQLAAQWLFATASRPLARAEIDPRVAGAFRFVYSRRGETIEYRGQYTAIEPHRRLAFMLADADAAATLVCVKLAPTRDGCELTLLHEDVPNVHATYVGDRWAGMLYGLDALLRRCGERSPSHDQE